MNCCGLSQHPSSPHNSLKLPMAWWAVGRGQCSGVGWAGKAKIMGLGHSSVCSLHAPALWQELWRGCGEGLCGGMHACVWGVLPGY